jgi:hypothetical protein
MFAAQCLIRVRTRFALHTSHNEPNLSAGRHLLIFPSTTPGGCGPCLTGGA